MWCGLSLGGAADSAGEAVEACSGTHDVACTSDTLLCNPLWCGMPLVGGYTWHWSVWDVSICARRATGTSSERIAF